MKAELGVLIEELINDGHDRLPSEEELSAQLAVSRATIRSALLSLQKDGVIQRVHGRGTFINRHALGILANISQDRPFADLLADLGHDVLVRSDDIRLEKWPSGVPTVLNSEQAEGACVIRRIFEASGKPAVFALDFVPSRLLQHTDIGALDGRKSVFDFIRHYTKRQVRYSVAEIVPTIPEAEITQALLLPPNAPMILLQHTHIDESDEPVAFTQAYINDHILRFSVVRTYTNS